jgi:drug/metabolite transporter (DMT)-like permease
MHPEVAGVLLAVMSACAFGTVAILARKGYEEGADPLPLLGYRFAIASALLIALARAMRRPAVPDPGVVWKLLLLGGVGFAIESSLFFIALDKAPAGIVSLVFFSFPMLTVLISWILRTEPVTKRTVLALSLGTAGVASIFTIRDVSLEGPLLALLAALSVAIYFTGAGVVMRGHDPLVGAIWTAVGAAVSILAVAFATGQDFPLAALPWAVALGVVTSIAFYAMYGAISRIGPAKAAVSQMLEPVVTVVLGVLILDEDITIRIAIGAALIVSALPILARQRHEAPPPSDSV